MLIHLSLRSRAAFAFLSLVFVSLHILWDYFHDGVPTHYLLHDPGMPGFSNWWSLLTLPVMTWILLYFLKQRIKRNHGEQRSFIWIRGCFGLGFGILLSIVFMMGYETLNLGMILGVIILSFFLPLFRAEYILGFLIGMEYVFGGVLPIVISLLLISIFHITNILRKGVISLISKGDS